MKIAIASGKGGTGKTFVSTNLYRVGQKITPQLAIVDCDAEEPNVTQFVSGTNTKQETVTQNLPIIDAQACTFCGKCYEYCNYNAICFLPQIQKISVIEELCHDCGACVYACKHGAITETIKKTGEITTYAHNTSMIVEGRVEVGVASPVPVIKKTIQCVNNAPIALLDSPPGISCPFIATVALADYVVLVTEPTPFALHNVRVTIETLQELNKPFGVIINRADIGNNESKEWFISQNIDILLEIPFDIRIAQVYSHGELLVDVEPHYYDMFQDLYATIIQNIEKWK